MRFAAVQMSKVGLVVFLAAVAVFSVACGGESKTSTAAAKPNDPAGVALPRAVEPVTIPSGTKISTRLLQTVSSSSAKAGDQFEAELAGPLAVDGTTVFAENTRVRGRVASAKASGRLTDPGYVRLTLDSIQAANGTWVDVKTTVVSAQGEGHGKRNATMIGGGAGLGALVGGIAGGGKGAAIGAGVGAGAGTAGAYATGKKDVSFPSESKLVFKIVRKVTVKT